MQIFLHIFFFKLHILCRQIFIRRAEKATWHIVEICRFFVIGKTERLTFFVTLLVDLNHIEQVCRSISRHKFRSGVISRQSYINSGRFSIQKTEKMCRGSKNSISWLLAREQEKSVRRKMLEVRRCRKPENAKKNLVFVSQGMLWFLFCFSNFIIFIEGFVFFNFFYDFMFFSICSFSGLISTKWIEIFNIV
jgi:hypothetical protein